MRALGSLATNCHALGTARMGLEGDAGAVVDQYCRVRGVDNLWIADASVMPLVPRTVPNLTVIVLGERVAARLQEHRGLPDVPHLAPP
jgi:choline dehydrogenase-like flavoprotein